MFEQVKAGKSHRKDGREMKGLGEQRITWKVTMSKKGEKVMERMRKARQRLTWKLPGTVFEQIEAGESQRKYGRDMKGEAKNYLESNNG